MIREPAFREGWRVVQFRDVAQNITERIDNPGASGLDHYVGLEHLDSDTLKISRWAAPSEVQATKLRFYPGDVIYARRRAYQRKLGVAEWDGLASAHALVLRARPDVCLPDFLPYFLQSEQFHQRAVGISVGSLSPTINWTTLAAQKFSLPPVAEQRRITATLGAFDDVAGRYAHASEVQLTSALLRDWFDQPPRSWRRHPLEQVAEVQLGRMLSADRAAGPDQAPYIKNTNIQWEGLVLDDLPTMSFPLELRERYELRAGDVLVCEGGDAGRSLILREDLRGIYYQKAVHRVRTLPGLSPEYLYFWLVHAYQVGKLRRLSTGSAILHLPAERLKALEIAVPPIEVQLAAVAVLRRSDEVTRTLRNAQASIEAARNLFLNSDLGAAPR